MTPRIGPHSASPGLDGSLRAAAPAGGAAGSRFARALRDAMSTVETAPTSSAMHTRSLSDSARALELQAAVYRDAERVELVSRLVDHAVGAVKTLLQTRF